MASELEKIGLRTVSSPFDWVVSDFEGVIEAIRHHFVDFLNYEYLYQSKCEHGHYKNTKYNIEFFHDFDEYASLEEQLPAIQKKYERRINRFYKMITEPTVFIRYISDEATIDGVSQELIYIEKNYDWIEELLKTFNASNEILFIANEGVLSTKFIIYNVKKDENDTVARNPITDDSVLLNKFSCFDLPDKQVNIERYRHKERYRRRISLRVKRRIIVLLKRIFKKQYVHENQY